MLYHANINIFIKYYYSDIGVSVAHVICGENQETELIYFIRSLRSSVNPKRPCVFSKEESASINELFCICNLQEFIQKLKHNKDLYSDYFKATEKDYKQALSNNALNKILH